MKYLVKGILITLLLVVLIMTGDYIGTYAYNKLSPFIPKIVSKFEAKKYIFLEQNTDRSYPGWNHQINKVEKALPKDAKLLSPEKITNVGYVFYLGLLDYDDKDVLSDKIKNEITTIISDAKFPKSLLNNLTFVVVNTLAIKPETYIETREGLIQIRDFNPDFLKSGGIYTQDVFEQFFIFIGKDLLNNSNQLKEVLTHELGHHVSTKLNSEDWKEYYKLRNIPAETTKQGTSWQTSPMEDFAEVYKNIFTGGRIMTKYGLLDSAFKSYDGTYQDIGPCMSLFLELSFTTKIPNNQIIYNTQLQNCRRKNYTSYTSIVDEETKKFVFNLLKN